MLNLRWRKIYRDLWGNKARSLLAMLSIMVGVFAVGMIAGTQHILTRDLAMSYKAVNPDNATILAEPFDDELVEVVRRMPDVRAAAGRRVLNVRVQIGPDQWQNLLLIAIPDFTNIQINKVAPVEGAWPPATHELVVERAGLGSLNARIGDSLQIKLPNGTNRTLKLAGVAYDPTQAAPLFSGTVASYITFDTLEWLGEPHNYNQLQLVVDGDTPDREHIKRVATLVSAKVEKSGHKVDSTVLHTTGKHPLDDIVQAMIIVLSLLAVLTLFLSGLLVANILGALLTQQTRQIGVMKSIGGRTSQIGGMYIGMVLLFGAVALLGGIPLGIVGAFTLSRFVAGLINFNLTTLSIPPQVILLEIGVGLLVPIIAGSAPIIKGTQITIREAITSVGLSADGVGNGLLDRLFQRIRAFPRTLLLSIRNALRHKTRLLLTVITLTLAGSLFIAILSVRESMLSTLAEALTYDNYNVGIDFGRPYRVMQLEYEAKRFSGVQRVESWSLGGARRLLDDKTESDNLFVYGIPAETTMIRPIVIQGRWLLPSDENAVVVNTEVLKDQPDIQIGATITLKIAGRKQLMRVVGLVKAVMAPRSIYINYPYYARITDTVGQASAIRVVIDQDDPLIENQTRQAMERHFAAMKLGIQSTQTRSDRREGNESRFNLVIMFLLIMAALLSFVGALGLAGMMSINVIERTREIGMMRAVGATTGAMLRVVIAEGISIGILSWPFSILVSLPLSHVLSDLLGSVIANAPFNYTFSFFSIFLWLAIVMLVAAVASLLPAWNAAQMTVRDALAYE